MIDTLQRLCATLATDTVTAGEAADSLGSIEEDGGESAPITVQPLDRAFSSAQVVRKFDTDEPAHVVLELSEETTLPVEELVHAFGDYSEVPMRPGRPQQIAFNVDEAGQPYTCTIFASVSPGSEGLSDGTVSGITVRRDIRLD